MQHQDSPDDREAPRPAGVGILIRGRDGKMTAFNRVGETSVMAFNKLPLFSMGEITRLLLSSVAQRTGRNGQGNTGEGALAAAPVWVPHAVQQRLRWGRGRKAVVTRKAASLQRSGTNTSLAESPPCVCPCAFGGQGGACREAVREPQSQKTLQKSRELAYGTIWDGKEETFL